MHKKRFLVEVESPSETRWLFEGSVIAKVIKLASEPHIEFMSAGPRPVVRVTEVHKKKRPGRHDRKRSHTTA